MPSFPLLFEFGTIGDVGIYVPAFPIHLMSPSVILLGKELRNMALPAKSWPRASEGWITWEDRLSSHFQGHFKSLGIA